MRSLLGLALLLPWLVACRPAASFADPSEPELASADQASGPIARWSYVIRVDDELETLQLELCIEGPRPRRLIAGDEALEFVSAARVRGGPALERDGRGLRVESLGEHGCLDLEIDLAHAVDDRSGDVERRGDTLMLPPDRWLWYPAQVPAQLEARARFELPTGVAATVPWPALDDDGSAGWRALDRTAFGWNAWIALGRYEPLRFVAAECEFEVAVLDADHRATREGIEAWLRAAAETSAELYGRFPRERVAVVVIPSSGWGPTPVLFGMARRGGGGSVMLLLDESADDDALPGEWVAVHELLHLGMPLVADPWMSEGFVTYYTHVLRARRGLLARGSADEHGDALEHQTRAALEILASGFADRPSARSLATASASMRQHGNYRRVYWGGAALAFDLDVSLRAASHNRHSLDDLMISAMELAPEHRRHAADDLLARMDEEVAGWYAAGELDREISCSAIAARHLDAKVTPSEIQQLRGIAVSTDDGRIRLLADPIDEVRVRAGLFAPKTSPDRVPE